MKEASLRGDLLDTKEPLQNWTITLTFMPTGCKPNDSNSLMYLLISASSWQITRWHVITERDEELSMNSQKDTCKSNRVNLNERLCKSQWTINDSVDVTVIMIVINNLSAETSVSNCLVMSLGQHSEARLRKYNYDVKLCRRKLHHSTTSCLLDPSKLYVWIFSVWSQIPVTLKVFW